MGGALGALTEGRIHGWQNFDMLHVSSSLGEVGNALTATGVRWDSIQYLTVATAGYSHASSTVFFPLYPLLIHLFSFVLPSAVVAGLLISAVAFAIALTLLHRLTAVELNQSAADATLLLLAFAPLSYFFTAVYAESVFLALSVGAVYAGRRDRWPLAAILGALAAITRVPGVLLVILLGGLYLRQNRRVDRRVAWLLLPPASLAGFLAYLAGHGYGWFAPISNQLGQEHAHRLAGPLSTVTSAVSAGVSGLVAIVRGVPVFRAPLPFGPFSSPAESVILIAVLLLAMFALRGAFRLLPAGYGLCAALTLIVCVYSPTIVQPLQSLDRYALTIFPLWMAAGAWLAAHRAVRPVVLVTSCLLALYSFEAARWFFIA